MGKTPKLSCTDKFGHPVVMTKACFDRHKDKRPELRDPEFFPPRVLKALQEPTFTIKGYVHNKHVQNVLCYYYEEYTAGGLTRYTKVIVDISHRNKQKTGVSYICSVWRPDKIQELRYNYKPRYH